MSLVVSEGDVFMIRGAGVSNHYHIVVNVNPEKGTALLLGVVTSHVALRKQDAEDMDAPECTIVDVPREQCSCLTHDSVVDCNSPRVIPLKVLHVLHERGRASYRCSVPKSVTAAIRHGVGSSKVAPREAQGLIY